MNNWIDLIQRLIFFRREIGQPIDEIFLPGLSREYILEKTLNYPFYFPEELIELYMWHNGTKDEGFEFSTFSLFRDAPWLSLENAIYMYENVTTLFPSEEPGLDFDKMFPLAGVDSFFYLMSYPEQSICPDINLPIVAIGIGITDVYYTSFASMLNMINECFEYGEHNENGYIIDGKLEYRIGYKHNPEIKAWKYEPFTVENSNTKTGYQFSVGAIFGVAIILIFTFSGLPIDLNYIQAGMGLILIIMCGLMSIIWSEIITETFK
jgi:hypothetical protein